MYTAIACLNSLSWQSPVSQDAAMVNKQKTTTSKCLNMTLTFYSTNSVEFQTWKFQHEIKGLSYSKKSLLFND